MPPAPSSSTDRPATGHQSTTSPPAQDPGPGRFWAGSRPVRWAAAGTGAIVDLLLPPTCRFCNQPVDSQRDFCQSCLRGLTLSEPMMQGACLRCGRPRPKLAESAANLLDACVQCRAEKLVFSGVIALWSYQDQVCEAVVAAKYGHQSPLGTALGRRLADRILTIAENNADFRSTDLITFVPSHFTRHFSRGGNGNQVIAEAICRQLRAKNLAGCCRSLLRMTRRIKKQAWLEGEQRRRNVRGAFALKKGYGIAKTIANRHILLIDDVLTTGATANEVARVLLDGGAARVTLAVVARAIRS